MDVDTSVTPTDRDPPQSCKLFIGGLSYDTTDASLSRYFEKYGQVASAVVMRDAATLRSRGFGFVTFCTLKAANDVVNYPKHLVDGRKVEAKFAVPRSNANKSVASNNNSSNGGGVHSKRQVETGQTPESFNIKNGETESISNNRSAKGAKPQKIYRADGKAAANLSKGNRNRGRSISSNSSGEKKSTGIIPNKIFVGGLLYATGHESLRKFFERYGTVETAEVIYNRDTKKSRGFGFVVFKTFESVRKVLQEQEVSRLIVDGKQVEVKLCVARHDSSAANLAKSFSGLELGLNGHNGDNSENIKSSKTSIPSASLLIPSENKWNSKSLISSFADVISSGDSTFCNNENKVNSNTNGTLGSTSFNQAKDLDTDDSALKRELESSQTDLSSQEPILDQSDSFASVTADSHAYEETLRSPLSSPIGSPFGSGLLEENPSFNSFLPSTSSDVWEGSEQKHVPSESSKMYRVEETLPPLDIGEAFDSNRYSGAFSEFCSSPISTGSYGVDFSDRDRLDSFKTHASLFSPLSSGTTSDLAQTQEFSMFAAPFEKRGS